LKTTAWQGIATLGIVGLVACGSQSSNWPKGAIAFCNPSSLTYTGDGGAGTVEPSLAAYVGTSQAVGIDIQDHGSDPLTISGVTISDTTNFLLNKPAPAALDGGEIHTVNPYPTDPAHAIVLLYFAPTKVGPITANLVISTNGSVDGGEVIVPINALGVSPDAGQFNSDGG
jgi:hypothetical protein